MDGRSGAGDEVTVIEETPALSTDTAPPRRRWTLKHTIASAVAVVLIGTAGTAYAVDRHNDLVREQIAAATVIHDDAVSSLTSARSDYVKAVSAAKAALTLVAPAEGAEPDAYTVTTASTVPALQALVTQSDALLKEVTGLDATIGDGAGVADIEAVTSDVGALKDKVVAATQKLVTATKAVTDSHDAYVLAQAVEAFDAAAADLTTQVEASQAVLDGSADKVADNAVRQALADSIDAARTAAGVTKGETADDLTAQTTAITDAKTDLVAKTQAVTDAQTAWQAEQDRLAAEAAARANSGSSGTKSSGGTRGSSGTKGSSSGGSSGGSTGGGSTGGGTVPPTNDNVDTTPSASTPGVAIAGLQAARAAAGLVNVSSCDEVPGSVQSNRGVVRAVTWQQLLDSPAHREVIMGGAPARMSAWNATGADGIHQVVEVQVWTCIVPS